MSELRPLWIDSPDGVREVAEKCASARRLALDTEADSMHSYFHKVCLIQASADGDHMVIDPLALEAEDLAPLWEVVSDPSIVVLMHGADYDIRILDRDFGARVGGLQDTQIMAQLLGEEKTGLAALLEKELRIQLDKKYQRADWGRRPLEAALVAYAAADTAYLGDLVARLRARLEERGRWHWALEDFRRLEGVRHASAEPDPLAFERIKGARGLRGSARDRLFSLYRWRDQQARARDVPPFKILGNKSLMAMAESPPSDLKDLSDVEGVGPRAVRRWGRDLVHLNRRPTHAPPRVRPPRQPTPDATERKRLKRLLEARDRKAAELGIQPGLLCSRGTVEIVAARKPPCTTLKHLARSGLEGWRLDVLGEELLDAVVED